MTESIRALSYCPPQHFPGYLCSVTNDAGRVFNIRLVRKGDNYGLSGCLIHSEDSPLIEFYDSTHANKPASGVGTGFGPLGQLVSRYYVETLTSDAADLINRGLNLHGGVDVWEVSGLNMQSVFDYLKQRQGY